MTRKNVGVSRRAVTKVFYHAEVSDIIIYFLEIYTDV